LDTYFANTIQKKFSRFNGRGSMNAPSGYAGGLPYQEWTAGGS